LAGAAFSASACAAAAAGGGLAGDRGFVGGRSRSLRLRLRLRGVAVHDQGGDGEVDRHQDREGDGQVDIFVAEAAGAIPQGRLGNAVEELHEAQLLGERRREGGRRLDVLLEARNSSAMAFDHAVGVENEVGRPADMAKNDRLGRRAGADLRPVALSNQGVQPLERRRRRTRLGRLRKRFRNEHERFLNNPPFENLRHHFKHLRVRPGRSIRCVIYASQLRPKNR
jgi:hypothetical protein